MTKIIFALVVTGLTVVTLLLPSPEPPVPGEVVAVDIPALALCPIEQGSVLDTTVAVVSTIDGDGEFTAFAGGVVAGSTAFSTGASGSTVIPVVDVAAVGVAGGLVELPNTESAAGSLIQGGELVAAEACVSAPSTQTVLAGGFTTGGAEFDVRIMNPYAGEARVDLTVRSESGIESASQLKGIAVPTRSTVTMDMDELLPGRESLTVTADTLVGNVMVVGSLEAGAGAALWNGVEPAIDWFVPAPSGGVGQVVVASGSGADAEFQVDVYGTGGVVEAFQEGAVPARGEVAIDVEAAGVGASAWRVVSTEPVAVFLRSTGEGNLALTNGSTATAPRWLLPGAGLAFDGAGRMVILNAGIEDSSVVVTALREQSTAVELPIPAGGVVELASEGGAARAHTVRGEGLFVPLWVAGNEAATAYSIGVPLIDE